MKSFAIHNDKIFLKLDCRLQSLKTLQTKPALQQFPDKFECLFNRDTRTLLILVGVLAVLYELEFKAWA